MMEEAYIVKKMDDGLVYQPAEMIENLAALKILDHPVRRRILDLIKQKPQYPAKIAKALKLHEQKVYYHVKQLYNAGIIKIDNKKEIRGTVAKKYRPGCLNYALAMETDWKPLDNLIERKERIAKDFLEGFIENGKIDAKFIVGNPEPHGPHKARARDGHYAIDLGIYMGSFGKPGDSFNTCLDVDADLSQDNNFIIVGGPVTNLSCAKINDFLPAKFSDKKPWGIISKKAIYTEDSTGMIAKIPNPYNSKRSLLIIAGIRFIGTKAAVMAFSRETKLVLARYTGQEKFACIVQGFDLKGDGKIDSIEVLE